MYSSCNFSWIIISNIVSSGNGSGRVTKTECWKYLFVLFSPLEFWHKKYWFLQTNLKWSWRRQRRQRRPSKWNNFKVTKAIEFMILNSDEKIKLKSEREKKTLIFVPHIRESIRLGHMQICNLVESTQIPCSEGRKNGQMNAFLVFCFSMSFSRFSRFYTTHNHIYDFCWSVHALFHIENSARVLYTRSSVRPTAIDTATKTLN